MRMLDLQKADLKIISVIKFESHDQNLLVTSRTKIMTSQPSLILHLF